MEIKTLSQDSMEWPVAGGLTLEVTLDLDDIAELKSDGARALEIERSLPAEAQTPLGHCSDDTYINAFIETRATNDALEAYGIVPVAIPHVKTSGLASGLASSDLDSGALYTCYVHVFPRPGIGLTSLDPVNIATKRIPKPGFSAQAASAGDPSVEFVDDDKTLRLTMIDRLDGELSEQEMRALEEEYTNKFERMLGERNIDVESYQIAHSLTQEQYALMMARRALNDAHWNYVLDAVFVGAGLPLSEDDLLDAFEQDFPGYSKRLFELYELRNELYMTVEKVRRAKALAWLRENAIR